MPPVYTGYEIPQPGGLPFFITTADRAVISSTPPESISSCQGQDFVRRMPDFALPRVAISPRNREPHFVGRYNRSDGA